MEKPKIIKARLKLFGGYLRRARIAREMTQEALSEKADLHIRVLQKMEAGETNILLTTLIRLRDALGCTWDDLLEGCESEVVKARKPLLRK